MDFIVASFFEHAPVQSSHRLNIYGLGILRARFKRRLSDRIAVAGLGRRQSLKTCGKSRGLV
jgi:hypothetical protein